MGHSWETSGLFSGSIQSLPLNSPCLPPISSSKSLKPLAISRGEAGATSARRSTEVHQHVRVPVVHGVAVRNPRRGALRGTARRFVLSCVGTTHRIFGFVHGDGDVASVLLMLHHVTSFNYPICKHMQKHRKANISRSPWFRNRGRGVTIRNLISGFIVS